jgi:Na+-transporting NADH:ubiquinone oxidoreductase subunit NqrD
MRRTSTKSPRAGDKERVKLPPAEDSMYSPLKQKMDINKVRMITQMISHLMILVHQLPPTDNYTKVVMLLDGLILNFYMVMTNHETTITMMRTKKTTT